MSYLHDLYYQIYYYRKFNYHTSFGLTLALEFFIRGATCLLVCIAIRKINEFALNSTAKAKETPEKTEEPATSYFTNIPYYIFQVAFYLIKKLMTFTHWVTSFLATLYLSLAPAFLHGFHLISFPTCMILMVSIYTFYFFSFVLRHVPIRKMKSEEGYKVYQRGALERWATVLKIAFLRYPIYYTVLALFCLSLALSIPILLDEMCICFFCDYGLPFNHESKLSSRMMRKFMIPDACPPGKPCHVYTTLPEDGSTSIFINAHTSLETENIKIYYGTLQNYQENEVLDRVSQPVAYKFDVEAKGARYVHSAYIGGLNENTEYYFEIHYGNEKQFSNKFKTLPSKGMERDLVIVSGGDVSSNERAQQMTEKLIPLKPDVIFIDGDAAYDDGMASCYYSYDTFFNMFERLNEKLGYMVPLVIAAGNHDLGVNSLNLSPISRDVDGPPFFMFLPQHSTIGDTLYSVPAVPDLHSRKTYFYHLIGNMLHVSLDSGYDVEFGGSQAVWLDKISYSYSDYAKFAHQHVPIYPACEDEDDMPTREAELAAQVWTPIFENHNYLGVFENHVHLMKKTYPLKKGQVHSDGVIYFGDGNWGVAPHGCSAKNSPINRKLFEEVGDDSHVWIMHVNKEGWEYYPLGLNGEKLMKADRKIFKNNEFL